MTSVDAARSTEDWPSIDPQIPLPFRVVERTVETHDSATIRLAPEVTPLAAFRGGQFTMLAVPGVGEVAVSISGNPADQDGTIVHTVRAVGAVSRALRDAPLGSCLGVRGPFGTSWAVGSAAGRDLVIVAGGVGTAPLRPVVLEALSNRDFYRRVVLIVGARSPDEFLFRHQLEAWRSSGELEVELTIDQPAAGWHGDVGFVTEPLARLTLDPAQTTAFLCGPEAMMRWSAVELLRKGLAPEDVRVSLERNMQCGIGLCGHCQLGPILVCRDGPVVDYALAEPLLRTREL